jgi:hypothetical protein
MADRSHVQMVETFEEQLRLWVDGTSTHVRMSKKYKSMTGDDFQCCPDFSCCQPSLLAPVEMRKAFMVASPKQRSAFLGQFLRALVDSALPQEKVYITDGTHEES